VLVLAAASGLGVIWRSRNGRVRATSHPGGRQPAGDDRPGRQPAGDDRPGSQPAGNDRPRRQPAGNDPPTRQPAGNDRPGRQPAGNDPPGRQLSAADLGAPLGSRATLVQFSTAFCAPCRATRRILGEVAGMVDGVRHVEIDAESRLDLVRRLDVYRTPTTFVLGPDGHVTHRASGQPRKADVIAALGAVL